MTRGAKSLVLLLICLALLGGCKKKKQPVVPPAPALTPSVDVPPPPAEPQSHPGVRLPVMNIPPVQPLPAKPQPKKSVARKTEPKPEIPKPEPVPEKKTAPANGSTEGNAQLAAGLPPGEVQQQRQGTTQLRSSTENTLRGLTRSLSSDEQAMVQQIRAYLQQSRTAESDGDTERAYNLAFKAHLLCEELIKR